MDDAAWKEMGRRWHAGLLPSQSMTRTRQRAGGNCSTAPCAWIGNAAPGLGRFQPDPCRPVIGRHRPFQKHQWHLFIPSAISFSATLPACWAMPGGKV